MEFRPSEMMAPFGVHGLRGPCLHFETLTNGTRR